MAIIISPPPISPRDPVVASMLQQPDPWLSRVTEAYECVAAAELAQSPLRLLAHAFSKGASDAPIILFSEVVARSCISHLQLPPAVISRSTPNPPYPSITSHALTHSHSLACIRISYMTQYRITYLVNDCSVQLCAATSLI